MLQKKICLLGDIAVGKTSLVRQFIDSIYSEKYLTTVGVKVDRKMIRVNSHEVSLMIWDTAGGSAQELQPSHIRGSAGLMFVADGTRIDTVTTAFDIHRKAMEILNPVPFVFLLNKVDLSDQWEINDKYLEALTNRGWPAIVTSAKTGFGVEEAFSNLTRKMLEGIDS